MTFQLNKCVLTYEFLIVEGLEYQLSIHIRYISHTHTHKHTVSNIKTDCVIYLSQKIDYLFFLKL
jgi:hypothetical protein